MLKFGKTLVYCYCLLGLGLALAACKESKPLESPVIGVTLYPTATLLPIPMAVPLPTEPPAPIIPATPTPDFSLTVITPYPPEPTPTYPPPYEEIGSTATRILKNGTSLMIQNVNQYKNGQPSSRIRVVRGNRAYWLITGAVFKAKFDYPKYLFTSYFCQVAIETLDSDDEPELIVYCGQMGSGGWGSIHIYSWQRTAYRLIWESVQRGIGYEVVRGNIKNDSPKMVVRYFYSPRYDIIIEWVNVYKLHRGRIIDVSSNNPDIYLKLLVGLHQMVAHQEQNLSIQETQTGAALWLAELHSKIAEAEAIIVKANKVNK